MRMQKRNIIDEVVRRSDYPLEVVAPIVTDFLDVVKEQLIEENEVVFKGLVEITHKTRSERMGFNPSTQEPMLIPERKILKAKFSKPLLVKLNGSES